MDKKKAFTLIEVLIACVLAGILFVLIFRSYVSITEISARLENEKKLNTEITFMTETVQNIADTYQIDYTKYTDLAQTQGRSDVLYLTGAASSGTMLMFSGDNLFWIHNNTTTALITSGQVVISQGKFKIIPFTTTASTFLDIQHPGFRLITSLQISKFNQSQRVRNVKTSTQQFFNLQRVE